MITILLGSGKVQKLVIDFGSRLESKQSFFLIRNKFKRSPFFDMSDDLFYQISLIGFLVFFSSMVFFLTKYREKKINNISHISITEQINF